jgi:galactose mutarotase-like enzyme
MFTIQNNQLQVDIQAKGAELNSIYHKLFGLEYLWSADPAYWAKKSPVLFPIIGALKNNSYSYQGHTYQLSRHGFAREREFAVSEQAEDYITFVLESDEQTMEVFPFPFRFSITYSLDNSQLSVTYTVENTGEDVMYFSVGGHPAFKLPLVDGTSYQDYVLEFNKTETAGRWPLDENGLIDTEPYPFFQGSKTVALRKALFNRDAVVLKHLNSDTVRLVSNATNHGLTFCFEGFPYLGLWAAKDADFLCIEPWCGIADGVDASGEWPDKEGLNELAAGKTFERSWQVNLF